MEFSPKIGGKKTFEPVQDFAQEWLGITDFQSWWCFINIVNKASFLGGGVALGGVISSWECMQFLEVDHVKKTTYPGFGSVARPQLTENNKYPYQKRDFAKLSWF